jgi:acyl carrier protein|tara:strand:- start:38 stop:295 length:258 start_codon:yes stop_codon:yes gene_type:complete
MIKKKSFSQKEKILENLIKKKIGSQKFNKIKKNENLLKNGIIDSMDFADIHSFIENEFKIKIPFFKIFGKNFNVTLSNIKKCLKL